MCVKKGYECDPRICNCKPEYHEHLKLLYGDANVFKPWKNDEFCGNNFKLTGFQPRLVIAESLVCDGVGLFSLQKIPTDSFITTYYGYYMSKDTQDELTSKITSFLDTSYIFEVNNEKADCIDSIFFGNKSRYSNHSHE